MRIVVLVAGLLCICITGCSSSDKTARLTAAQNAQVPYLPVSGDIGEMFGVNIEITCVPRSELSNGYSYATEKVLSPLITNKKYVVFEIKMHNPYMHEVQIPTGSVQIIDQTHTEYFPLSTIEPNSNKAQLMMRNLHQYQTKRQMYGILVFENLPEDETEIKLQLQVEIDGQIDYHYAIFKRVE